MTCSCPNRNSLPAGHRTLGLDGEEESIRARPIRYGGSDAAGGKVWYVHVFAYLVCASRQVDGMVIDHICERKSWVNPRSLAGGSCAGERSARARAVVAWRPSRIPESAIPHSKSPLPHPHQQGRSISEASPRRRDGAKAIGSGIFRTVSATRPDYSGSAASHGTDPDNQCVTFSS